jgi:hypothetical protein
MVFFLSNMIENQCMSTGAFEITLNGRFHDELHVTNNAGLVCLPQEKPPLMFIRRLHLKSWLLRLSYLSGLK